MRKPILLLLLLLGYCHMLHAQGLVVSGTVVDDSSRAGIAGVSVVVTERGTA